MFDKKPFHLPKLNLKNPFDEDGVHEECGVFGAFNYTGAAALTVLGLHALQHRGQEAAGIFTFDGNNFYHRKELGHVGEHFNSADVISALPGDMAIGHVRYSTTGSNSFRNIQPVFAELSFGGLAISHNGNLTNTDIIKKDLIGKGCIFQSTMDTEVIMHLIAISKKNNLIDKITDALKQIEGAYSLAIMSSDTMIGIRDPLGIRPLLLGKKEGGYFLASESCAFDIVGIEYIRDIEAGEMVVINKSGIQSLRPFENAGPKRFCIFEYVYFARPDSVLEGKSVYQMRKNIGIELAKEAFVEADIVVPVPDSGVASAIGYSYQSKIPFDLGIIRNHYVGRTFIEPAQQVRDLGVKLKHNANMSVIKDKKVILIDDSIVRGTTSKKIVAMVREAGAKEIHMRIASPPTAFPCYYGVDTPERSKLIAANHNVDEIANIIGVDSLSFLSLDGLYRAIGKSKRDDNREHCDACFSGDYPVKIYGNKE